MFERAAYAYNHVAGAPPSFSGTVLLKTHDNQWNYRMRSILRDLVGGSPEGDLQHTIARSFTLSGIGLHTGLPCDVTVAPAPSGTGVVFVRQDIPGTSVQAQLDFVGGTTLSTSLYFRGAPYARTVEHVMSALSGCGVDNAVVYLSNVEVPILGGGAIEFANAISRVGLQSLDDPREWIRVQKRVEVRRGKAWAKFVPSGRNLVVDATIDFDSPYVGVQRRGFVVGRDDFITDIASARTFCLESEIPLMRSRGLGLGGSLDNAVVFGQNGVINDGGLRFEDECVRHKILDVIGDLSLIGRPIIGLVICNRCGHELNLMLARALLRNRSAWSLVRGRVPSRSYQPEAAIVRSEAVG